MRKDLKKAKELSIEAVRLIEKASIETAPGEIKKKLFEIQSDLETCIEKIEETRSSYIS